jgi:IclR family transcriptional regulator, mhp operon transcriptional activator
MTTQNELAEQSGPVPYKEIKSLIRGLQIIEVLSQLGWAKIGEISTVSGIDRTSVYRLINTLVQAGYLTRRLDDGAVALTPKLVVLADTLKNDDIVIQFAWPYLFALSKDVLWPCDFASLDAGKVIIRLSTHKISPKSIHRRMVGKERYLLRSALGLAILSAMSDEERERSLLLIERLGDSTNSRDVRDRKFIGRTVDAVRRRGYASSSGQTEAKISAIALPVMGSNASVAGAINVVFFRSAMTTEKAAERYLGKMKQCVSQIEQSLKDFADRRNSPES